MAKLHINRWRTKCTFAFSPPVCAFPSLTAPLHAPLPFYTARHTPPQRRARTPAPLSLAPVRSQNASPKHRISRTCLVISNEHCTFAHGNQRQDHKERCRSGRTGRTRNAVNGQLFRGFESLSLRKQGCKSVSYTIYTLYYTRKSTHSTLSSLPPQNTARVPFYLTYSIIIALSNTIAERLVLFWIF